MGCGYLVDQPMGYGFVTHGSGLVGQKPARVWVWIFEGRLPMSHDPQTHGQTHAQPYRRPKHAGEYHVPTFSSRSRSCLVPATLRPLSPSDPSFHLRRQSQNVEPVRPPSGSLSPRPNPAHRRASSPTSLTVSPRSSRSSSEQTKLDWTPAVKRKTTGTGHRAYVGAR